MGTRHLQIVIDKTGKEKIRQYGQWDGYPSGQGVDILKYLKKGDLEKYQENLGEIKKITKKQTDMVNKDPRWHITYPYLSRDCGSKLHKMIEDGEVMFVQHIDNKEARFWCEGFYTIDFQKREFTAEYYESKKTYSLDDLPKKKQFLKDMTVEEE